MTPADSPGGAGCPASGTWHSPYIPEAWAPNAVGHAANGAGFTTASTADAAAVCGGATARQPAQAARGLGLKQSAGQPAEPAEPAERDIMQEIDLWEASVPEPSPRRRFSGLSWACLASPVR